MWATSARTPRHQGFTLIELLVVVSIIGIFATLAHPSVTAYKQRIHIAEAQSNLEAIAALQMSHRMRLGRFLACPANPGEVPKRGTAPWVNQGPWAQLGFAPTGPTRFQYEVRLTDEGFVAEARADFDGDGTPSRYWVTQSRDGIQSEQGWE